jgi:GMP synthase-like glutamine amidotransferase
VSFSQTTKEEPPKGAAEPVWPYRVFIVGGNHLVRKMFTERGHTICKTLDDNPEMVCFTGGADVAPFLYGERPHKHTSFDMARDLEERQVFGRLTTSIPKVGICRGGQFLNVLSGGSLWQHVDNHAINGTHEAITYDGNIVTVTSTHHQMIRPHKEAWVLLGAQESSFKEGFMGSKQVILKKDHTAWDNEDVEACWYANSNAFCFQPHPELSHKPTRELFFEWVDMLFAPDIRKMREQKAKLVKHDGQDCT